MPTATATRARVEVETINGWRPVRPIGAKLNRMRHKQAMEFVGLNPRSSRSRWSEDLRTLDIPERTPLTGEQVLQVWKLNVWKQYGGTRPGFLNTFAPNGGAIDFEQVDQHLIEVFDICIASVEQLLREQGYLPRYTAAA